MSGGASNLRDVRKLADARASIELDIPAAQLPDIPKEWSAGGGVVHLSARFGREQSYASARVRLHARLRGICQRCLAEMEWEGEASSPVLFVESESDSEHAPEGWETLLAPEGRVNMAVLAAEEVLLALPIVPLHANLADCHGPGAEAPAPDASAAENGGDAGTKRSGKAGSRAKRGAGAVLEQGAAEEQAPTTRPFADLRALLERGGKSRE